MQSLTRDQILALLRCARTSRERDWLMILTGFVFGLRATELVSFTRDAIADGFLTIQRLKGSLRTVQPLPENSDPLLNLKSALIDYAEKANPGEPVFNISRQHFWRLVQRYAKESGIPAHLAHPHILKHSIAMQTIHSAGIENVRQHLGHKSISSTGAYLKVSDEAASKAVMDAIKGV